MKYWLARYLRRWADRLYPLPPPTVEFEAIHLPNSHTIVFRDRKTGDITGCCGTAPSEHREEAN